MKTLTNADEVKGLRERLVQLDPADPALWGKMTAPDMVVHLRQIFRAVMGEIQVGTPPPMPKPVPLPAPVLKWIALQLPLRWPTTIKTPAPFEVGSAWMNVADFEADRRDTIAAMERFAQGGWTAADHPLFGTMSFADWTRWGWLHVDHHLRQFCR